MGILASFARFGMSALRGGSAAGADFYLSYIEAGFAQSMGEREPFA
jgi:hypothetical protein